MMFTAVVIWTDLLDTFLPLLSGRNGSGFLHRLIVSFHFLGTTSPGDNAIGLSSSRSWSMKGSFKTTTITTPTTASRPRQRREVNSQSHNHRHINDNLLVNSVRPISSLVTSLSQWSKTSQYSSPLFIHCFNHGWQESCVLFLPPDDAFALLWPVASDETYSDEVGSSFDIVVPSVHKDGLLPMPSSDGTGDGGIPFRRVRPVLE